MNDLFQNLFYDKRIIELYTSEKSIQYLLDFEAHLAKAQAECQFIPSQFSEIIAHCCKVEKIDMTWWVMIHQNKVLLEKIEKK